MPALHLALMYVEDTCMILAQSIMQAGVDVRLTNVHRCITLSPGVVTPQQIGGSDQLGNILTGLELARKLGDESSQPLPPCYGLCFPLLTTSDGVKMGKSAAGAVWLAPGKISCTLSTTSIISQRQGPALALTLPQY